MNLYEQLETLATVMGRSELPDYIVQGLPPQLELRPYQRVGLADFIRYYETDTLRTERPTQVLFHMATGSGKTVLMAALLLFLYERGYRNFIFFVNSTNVLEKTKTNFLDPSSPKYLFAPQLKLNGKPLELRLAANFQLTESDAINIRFTTIQGLHSELTNPREGGLSESDFDTTPVVFISDEAHHLNALTRSGLTTDEERIERSWEGSVNRVFGLNRDNLLLEFTATCDLANTEIAAKYSNKIVADYPLRCYREDRYSKEIKLLQSNLPPLERALQAIVLSQYRLKLFQKHGLTIKPVLLMKSRRITESASFVEEFHAAMSSLGGRTLSDLPARTTSGIVRRAFDFFDAEGISMDALAAELREDFSETRCLALNHQEISPAKQIAVNTLESRTNPFRVIFAVDMLNEGWDVLNLFDIVRLYETRDAREGRPGSTTIREAQLIGRGARYCPFRLTEEQDIYRRKFDEDLGNELRACEELYFHSATNERYISELTTALKETGALPDRSVEVHYELKPEFESSDFYREGWVFLNQREVRSRRDITALPDALRALHTMVDAPSGATHTTGAFDSGDEVGAVKLTSTTEHLRSLPAAVVSTALRRNNHLRFDALRQKLPNLSATSEFITSPSYLGDVKLTLRTPEATPSRDQWLHAAEEVLRRVADALKDITLEYRGSRTFRAFRLHEKLGNRTCYVENPRSDGLGVPQRDAGAEMRLRLSELQWYAYEENYGTTEEKRFLFYFNTVADSLAQEYDLVVVMRNEGQVGFYDFDTGSRFEPDFLLFLQRSNGPGYEQFQVFVEPKGAHLTDKDRWKEDLLMRLRSDAVTVKQFADDNEYRVWGLPFFTHDPPEELRRFTDALDAVGG